MSKCQERSLGAGQTPFIDVPKRIELLELRRGFLRDDWMCQSGWSDVLVQLLVEIPSHSTFAMSHDSNLTITRQPMRKSSDDWTHSSRHLTLIPSASDHF
jgi:hypothetical protein